MTTISWFTQTLYWVTLAVVRIAHIHSVDGIALRVQVKGEMGLIVFQEVGLQIEKIKGSCEIICIRIRVGLLRLLQVH